MKLTLGFSPCPNDTYIFDAIVNGRIDTEGLEFDYFLADVEELNRKAFTSEVDITKISCHAYAYVAADYLILDTGGALGFGNGPLLICKNPVEPDKLKDVRIAIPGKYTTANLLFSIAWPEALNKTEYLFSDIEEVLLREEADAGLIIHETRFTYQRKGLYKIADMGEFWEKLTGLPIPLGSIVIHRRIPEDIAIKFNRILRRSIEYAGENALASYDFVASNAREMESTVMNSHIELFVNQFSISLGTEGKRAIKELFRISHEKGITPALPGRIFLT
ncbi:MAG TPA: 1,4-dihydroxy-6-naphthoate synthase [Bacteroidales bacterium]|jgi:1,4-dihydroxy-6-naphthoate synthase|nr:1,4-dihydroxy-6-naphthoate synthase [Bacteroidales bacterium]HBZ22547.1 1,4-dihydroxy-6-naphthoate synthase [Bacteroidales bacterium]